MTRGKFVNLFYLLTGSDLSPNPGPRSLPSPSFMRPLREWRTRRDIGRNWLNVSNDSCVVSKCCLYISQHSDKCFKFFYLPTFQPTDYRTVYTYNNDNNKPLQLGRLDRITLVELV